MKLRINLLTSALAVLATAFASHAIADDMTSFATGGFASGLMTMDMMHKMDTNHDGMVSKDEWTAFQEKMFAALDKDKSGYVDEKEFLAVSNENLAFATAAYVQGLGTKEMFAKLDTNHDGKISHDEFMSYMQKGFDMMDKSKKGMLGPTDWIHPTGK